MSSPEDSLRKALRLKETVRKKAAEVERRRGARQALQDRLRDEFGCEDVGTAEALLASLRASVEAAEVSLQEKMEAYDEEFGESQ